MKKQNILTKKEELIMDVFWKEPDPRVAYLTIDEIKEKMHELKYSVIDLSWNVKTLQQKGYIDNIQLEQELFVPTKTREEYLVDLVLSKGMEKKYVTKFIGKLIKRVEIENELEEAEKVGQPIRREKLLKNVKYIIDTYDERSED